MAQVRPLQDLITKGKIGQTIILKWLIKNGSKRAWPAYPRLKNFSDLAHHPSQLNGTQAEEPVSLAVLLQPGEEYELVYSFDIPLSYDEKFFTLNLGLVEPAKSQRFGDGLIAIIELLNFHDQSHSVLQHSLIYGEEDDDAIQESIVIEEGKGMNLSFDQLPDNSNGGGDVVSKNIRYIDDVLQHMEEDS
jgi:hypothetical protein